MMSEPKIELAAVWPRGGDAKQLAAQGRKLLEELGPMMEQRWLQVRGHESWAFDLDVELLVAAWQMRALVVMMARVDDAPAAYALGECTSMLLARHKQFNLSSIHVQPGFEALGLAGKLRAYAEEVARAMGVKRMVVAHPEQADVVFVEPGA